MLDVSNVHCYDNACESLSDADDDDEEETAELLPSGGTRFPLVPCCLVVENAHKFGCEEAEVRWSNTQRRQTDCN